MPRTLAFSAYVFCLALLVASAVQAKPDVATPEEVQSCRFIENVSGSSGYGKNAGWMPIAKSKAERKAGSLGATHIVWTSMRSTGAFNGAAEARAYDCQR
ncbi:hypothetical protein [Methylotetracoccus oryzae]|uniref:hypothetical protein n=1 Tax=Methylotetracoccus oryzae TaxID=1919059 RepID=UPI001F24F98D|nr:hypothetical protein [Methylotetracoccus oryzae]